MPLTPSAERPAHIAGRRAILGAALGAGLAALAMPRIARAAAITLLNVSYDPTRELFRDINRAFAAAWREKTGDVVTINMSHGGSGAQARAVLDGLPADVVTLALAADIDALATRGLVAKDWPTRLPDSATPFTSTIVFLTRAGNPKGLRDWPDLLKPGVSVIVPNPKTSGGARWIFLAVLAWARRQPGSSAASEAAAVRAFYKNVPVLDTGSRGSTTTFAQRGLGDVLVCWENEAGLARQEFGESAFSLVYPSISMRAEPPVSVVDAVVDKRGTRAVATAYLEFLYTPQAQEIEATHDYRPRDAQVLARFASRFPAIPMLGIEDFGGWDSVQKADFDDGGLFDKIYVPTR